MFELMKLEDFLVVKKVSKKVVKEISCRANNCGSIILLNLDIDFIFGRYTRLCKAFKELIEIDMTQGHVNTNMVKKEEDEEKNEEVFYYWPH